MKSQSTNDNPSMNRNERGVVLIISLVLLAIVTVLMLAFAAVMRMESAASKNHRYVLEARQLAKSGLSEALARLMISAGASNSVIGGVTNATYFSIPSPGRIVNGTISAAGVTPNASFWLYSDSSASTTNINMNSDQDIIPDAAADISVQWVPVNNSAGALVGRYCYWIDDESAKVNINCAFTNALTHTASDIDLNGLPGVTPTDISRSRTCALSTYGVNAALQATGFPTTASWDIEAANGQPPGVATATYSQNVFNVTAFSQSTKLTPWGTPCLNLNWMGITNSAGVINGAGMSVKTNAVRQIFSYLTNGNLTATFPGFAGTFLTKYGSNCWQIAANIVDYIDDDGGGGSGGGLLPTSNYIGQFTNGTAWFNSNTTYPTYLGLEKTAYLNELVISNSVTIVTNGFGSILITNCTSTCYVELWYPWNTAATYTLNSRGIYVWVPTGNPALTVSAGSSAVKATPLPAGGPGFAWSFTGTEEVPSQGYFVASTNINCALPTSGTPISNLASSVTITLNAGSLTAALMQAFVNGGNPQTASLIDLARIPVQSGSVTVSDADSRFLAGGRVVTNLMWISACAAPTVKPISTFWNPLNWKADGTGSNGTLGGWNLGKGGPYDYKTNATPWAASATMIYSDRYLNASDSTPPSCSFAVRADAVNSRDRNWITLSELGFIQTGLPWRSLMMQPAANDTGAGAVIPDWAMLDLFTCTNEPTAGRININALVQADSTSASAVTAHENTFNALMYNRGVNVADFMNRTGYTPPAGWGVLNTGYAMVGQICEVPCMLNSGVKSNVEGHVRAIADLINVRSDTFTIWVRAQAIWDLPSAGSLGTLDSTDLIVGEARLQTVVQRDARTGRWQIIYQRWM